MTTKTTEAAERLLDGTESPMFRQLLDEARAAERRATVERIRERLDTYEFDRGDYEFGWKSYVRAILDEEATAPS